MSIDDLIAAYIEARNAVEWEAEKRGLLPLTNDMSRAGVRAVVVALRDELTSVSRLRDVQRLFDEILGVAEFTGGMNDLSVTPATDAAPAVCVWKLADEDVVESGCGQPYSAEVMRDICPSCGKPIAFTGAK